MIYNYFKIALRSIWRFKGYALTNIMGLSAGIACCLLILLFVNNEWQYDTFHDDADRIYRVTTMEKTEDGFRHLANAFPPLAPRLQTAFPELEQVVRYFPYSVSVKNPENNTLFQEKDFYFADSLFFTMFSFQFEKGNPARALMAPNSLVLTQETVKRYFGDADPIGKTLEIDNKHSFVITAVVEDLPGTSSLQFDFVAAMPAINNVMGSWVLNSGKSWHYPPMQTFVKLAEGQSIEPVRQRMGDFEEKNMLEHLQEMYDFQYQPLKEMHFTALEGDLAASVRPAYLYILIVIAVMILAIACVNYINLALSRLIQRLREIGMRRVLGAQNRQILLQMFTESAIYLVIAFTFALFLVNSFLPTFNNILEKQLVFWDERNIMLGLGVIGTVALIAVLISLFPALALFRFQLGGILKSEHVNVSRKFSGFSFKNSFVVFQFTVAIALIVATVIVQYQLSFIQKKDLGLQPEQTLVIPIRDEAVQQNYETIKNTLSTISGVVSVSALSNFPWEGGYYDFPAKIEGKGKNIEADIPVLLVDEDFLRTMKMEVVQGRDFRANSISDKQSAFLINEAAAEKYGIEEIEGMRVSSDVARDPKAGGIIGIVKNFHMKSLHHPIDPVVITVSPESYYIDNFVVRLETANLAQTIQLFTEKWSEVSPDRPFEYFFLDEAFAELYRKETRMGTLFSYFTLLALFIACLGMFALAAFMSERRTKEIGIRKVLGANVSNIITLLSKDFVKLVIIAVIFAFPIAWWAMNRWLQDFAFRIDIQWWMFAIAGVGAVTIALLTVSFQAIRAATANPVDSLKTE